jgi:hypothetical protein
MKNPLVNKEIETSIFVTTELERVVSYTLTKQRVNLYKLEQIKLANSNSKIAMKAFNFIKKTQSFISIAEALLNDIAAHKRMVIKSSTMVANREQQDTQLKDIVSQVSLSEEMFFLISKTYYSFILENYKTKIIPMAIGNAA